MMHEHPEHQNTRHGKNEKMGHPQSGEQTLADLFHAADGKGGHGAKKNERMVLLLGAILALTILVQAFNFTQQAQIRSQMEDRAAFISSLVSPDRTGTTANYASASSGLLPDVIPKGVPRIYGAALGIQFEDVSPNDQQKANRTIEVLSQFDREKSEKLITLAGEEEERYIRIVSQISCEYCCGAESIIFSNGQRACGCAHSYAMRGIAKYLVRNYPGDFTDDQILEEVGKWKTLFFPGILTQKAKVLEEKGIELNYINLASNKYRGIEKGAPQGGNSPMVGGC